MINNQKVKSKIKTPKEFVLLSKQLKKSGKTLVQCDGVFDLVHPGHLDYFWRARANGDILYVVLLADKFVQKGPGRPLFKEDLRAMWVAAIEGVDFVIVNNEYNFLELIREIRPHFLVKGAEYQTNPSEGFLLDKALVESYGGKVAFVKELAHSSEILRRIYQHF